MQREWLRVLTRLLRGEKRPRSLPKIEGPSITLPGISDSGVTVHVTTLEHIHGHTAGGGFGGVLDYVFGFVVIGLALLGGHFWLQRDSGQDLIAPWHAGPGSSGSAAGSSWTLSSPKPLPAAPSKAKAKPSQTSANSIRLPDTPPVATHVVAARYTDWARSEGFHGKIFVKVTVDETGVPVKFEPVARIPFDLNQPIREALYEWRFQPALLHGQAVQAVALVEIPFR